MAYREEGILIYRDSLLENQFIAADNYDSTRRDSSDRWKDRRGRYDAIHASRIGYRTRFRAPRFALDCRPVEMMLKPNGFHIECSAIFQLAFRGRV